MKKRSGAKLTIFFLAMSLFIIGAVVGMIIVHISNQKDMRDMEKAYKAKISELEEKTKDEITYVYVPERKRVYGNIPINSYIPENFRVEDGFMAYFDENGEKISHLGVDLSYHQNAINWDELENAVDFVMLRCGYRGYSEGGLVEDEKFREYAKECNDRGIPLGVYFYTQSITVEEAVKEAEFTLDLIKDYELSYPVAYDTEYVVDETARTRVNEISDELRSEMAVAFCERIKEEGYYPMIYASENWIRRNLIADMIQEYDLWAPQYLDENDFMYDFTIWQYTESGYIPGISTEVDLDISMVDYADFVPKMRQAYLEGNLFSKTASEDSVIIDGENGEDVNGGVNIPSVEIESNKETAGE
ncbi:MAG: glycoside hydrolase family 25 protein [Lachnospiraceae bacterium]|nr:glycoside hydrolase family 25 protein [Lachnospiraceae bacterium]